MKKNIPIVSLGR